MPGVNMRTWLLMLTLACDDDPGKGGTSAVEGDSADTDSGPDDDTGPGPLETGQPGETGVDTGPADPCDTLDCDDGDACTVDSCGEGVCSNEPWTGTALDLFDMPFLTDPTTLDTQVLGSSTEWEGLTPVTVYEIRYTSYEYEACELRPIRIEAYLGVPSGVGSASPAPGVVIAHGLGAYADAGNASSPAGQWDVVSLAYSGPGQGASEGTGSTSEHLFDTAQFPGNSWFWEHAVAAIRGLTVLAELPEVDADRLAMTGYSGGSVATLMVNGVDERLSAVAPVSASGHLDLAIAAEPNHGWEYDLLQELDPPLDASSDAWLNYVAYLDPANYLPTAHGSTLLVDGAQDEFFPLNSAVASYEDLLATGGDHRLLSVVNWDHGMYALFTSDEAQAVIEGTLGWWMWGQLGTDTAYAAIPPQPEIASIGDWTCWYDGWYPYSCAYVVVDVGDAGGYDVEGVRLHFSGDNAYTFGSWNLQDQGGGLWAAEVGTLDWTIYNDSNLVYFADVTYQEGLFGPEFQLSSTPYLYAGFSPYIIPIPE